MRFGNRFSKHSAQTPARPPAYCPEHRPAHLMECTWLAYEQERALIVWQTLARELSGLAVHATARQVHDTRVALRRWESIWKVLKSDGWNTKKYWHEVGRHIRKLYKLLGDLRDWDVNLEIGQASGLPDDLITEWSGFRSEIENAVNCHLDQCDFKRIIKLQRQFILRRPTKLVRKLEPLSPASLLESAYDHIEPFLQDKEARAQELERKADSPESLHQFRLSIKAWRYILVEFYGLTNLELVRASTDSGQA